MKIARVAGNKKRLAVMLGIAMVLIFTLPACGGSSNKGGDAPAPSEDEAAAQAPAPPANDEVYYVTAEVNYPKPEAGVITQYFDDLTEISGGRLQFDIYYGASLNGMNGMLQALETGVIQCGGIMPCNYDAAFPYSGALFNMPFLGFEDMEGASSIWLDMYNTTPEMQAEFEGEGLWVAAAMANPIYDLHLSKDINIRVPSNLRGVSILTQEPEITEVVNKIGGAAVVAEPADFYQKLDNNIASGVVQQINTITSLGVSPDLIKKHIRFDEGGGFTTSILTYVWRQNYLDSLPHELQGIIYQRSATLGEEMLENDSAIVAANWEKAEAAGSESVFLTRDEVQAWDDVAKPITLDALNARAAQGADNILDVYDKLTGRIGEYYGK